MVDWKEYLLRSARLHRMCDENRDALKCCESKSQAIALYKRTIDWALEEDYPSIDFLRREFADCESDGMYIDKHFDGDLLFDQQVYVLHHCTGTICVDLNVRKRIIPMIYLANGCNIRIVRKNDTGVLITVPIYSFGENKVNAVESDDVEFKIYHFDLKQM